MDCNNQESQQLNKQSKAIESSTKRIYYSKVEHPQQIWQFGSYDIIEVQNRLYIFQGNGAILNIYDIQTGNNQQFPIKGLIQRINVDKNQILILTSSRFYQIMMVNGQIKILYHITIVSDISTQFEHQVSKYGDIILWRRQKNLQIIKLGVQNRRKTIFKINVNNLFNLDKVLYHKLKEFLLFYQENTNIQVLDVINKKWKNLQVGYRGIKLIKFEKNTLDLFYEEWGEGLFVKKINYLSGKIQEKKFLYYEMSSFQILKDNKMLALLTQNYYVKFNQDYNIMRKFQIRFNEEEKLSKIYKLSENNQGSYLIFQVQTQGLKEQFKIYKQNDSLNRGSVWIQEIQNYHVELKQLINFDISQNQQYLALGQQNSLILYQMELKIENKYIFNENMKFLGFSTNQSNLYLTFKNKIICYKFQQNMKINYSQICKDDKAQQRQYLPSKNGIFTLINHNGIRIFISQQRKQIFRLKCELIMKNQYKFQIFDDTLLISENKEFFIFRLSDRLLKLKVNLDSVDYRLKDEQKLMILTNNGQLLLWDLSDQFVIQQQFIMDNIQSICNSPQGLIILRSNNQIIKLEKSLQFIERFETQAHPLFVTENYVFIRGSQNCEDLTSGFQLIKWK